MKTLANNVIDTDVLIIGAGPTGLAVATVLQQAGFEPVVIEKLNESQNTSRAAVIHAHTLDVLQELGISQRLIDEGLLLQRFSIRDRDKLLARLSFEQLPGPFQHLLMLPQDRTERILGAAFATAKGCVKWASVAESLVEKAGFVEATVLSHGVRTVIRARYVVGADGMNSMVRETAGIGFTGSTYGESFILADLEMDWPLGRDEVGLFFSPEGLVVIAPLPGGCFRVVATLEDAPAQPRVADLQALLDSRGPQEARAKVQCVHWSSRFRIHHRLADAYRRGPYFLVGDAAHVHSPAGGQGMNTGLVDACLLGRMLKEVLSGRKEDSYLDKYEALRRPAANAVLNLAGRLTRIATLRTRHGRRMRNMALWFLGRLPTWRQKLTMNLSGLSRMNAAKLPE